ncbi:hypothetical protein GU243_08330 [Pseudarthrobacter psychrotolerans]|uniref:DUF2975 domain-containing protein n=1 Tax=Pseudarthrobacter psychrotolerans TaxID=2697569 RepID=A0A6P1NMH8_9MICC|nr:hypothetical protein [Pseudarthrobacter psychrotolerans]QHK19734.1 hypothetical protein GU243_08330 [Pseudarthrobacter psychrotolerans]
MKLTRGAAETGQKKVVSRTDAIFLMIASGFAALVTTAATVFGTVGLFTGPVTLVLPVATSNQTATGLSLEATGHFTSVEATIPVLPSGSAANLAWAGVLNQVGILAILALVFLLAYRLQGRILFTARSAHLVGAAGIVLVVAGMVGQVLDGMARSRLAEMIGANARVPEESQIFSANFNLGPLMLGIVLLLVAGVFEYGRRLQKDTEGLV